MVYKLCVVDLWLLVLLVLAKTETPAFDRVHAVFDSFGETVFYLTTGFRQLLLIDQLVYPAFNAVVIFVLLLVEVSALKVE